MQDIILKHTTSICATCNLPHLAPTLMYPLLQVHCWLKHDTVSCFRSFGTTQSASREQSWPRTVIKKIYKFLQFNYFFNNCTQQISKKQYETGDCYISLCLKNIVVFSIVSVIKVTTSSLLFMQYGKHYPNFCNKSETFEIFLYIFSGNFDWSLSPMSKPKPSIKFYFRVSRLFYLIHVSNFNWDFVTVYLVSPHVLWYIF